MTTKLLMIGLTSLCLMACTNKQLITESHVIKLKPPVINPCQRMIVKDCQPTTNGELFECALQISKQLALCADQTDALIEWQNSQ